MENAKIEKRFRRVYAENYALLLNMIRKRVSNLHDSEEICHDLFVSLYRKFGEVGDPSAWLKASVRYEVLNYYRRTGKHSADVSLDELEADSAFFASPPLDDNARILREALQFDGNYETEQERTIFMLIAISRYTYKEVACEMGLSRRQVEYAYSKTCRRIMDYIRGQGLTGEEI
jgi:RNA polymerase sigma factor (sigma-70 family)